MVEIKPYFCETHFNIQ